MKYFLGSPTGVTFDQIIDAGNSEHFSKLSCSIIPTISYWRNPINRITEEFLSGDYNICFEYPVKSIKGAKASYTDVMLISSQSNVAVESKWNEKTGFYCRDQKAKMKFEVQSHWIKIISNYIGRNLNVEEFSDIEYQLLHRVASACSLNKKECIVVYQIFYTKNQRSLFIDEIQKIKSVLKTNKIKFYLNSVKIVENERNLKLEAEIKNLYRNEKVELIKHTLKRNDLFILSNEELIAL